MSPLASSPDPLEQLIRAWHQRAEAIRQASPGSPPLLARADTLDSCAAQLAEAVRACFLEEGDAGPDRETLSLFLVQESA
jgi:hypothetical protein